jgi:hypothetical protein
MSKMRMPFVALAVSVAVVAAGCGSSSKSKSQSTPATAPAAASTPATPSTTGTTGTTAATGAQITAQTPITSPTFRSLLIKGEAQAAKGRLSQKELGELADCAIKKFQAEGVKTAGEAAQHQSQSRSFGAQCAQELNIRLH